MHVHSPCGAEVVVVVVQAGEPVTTSTGMWGTPVLVDRVLRAGAQLVFHQCRDFVAWHAVEPDRRDPHGLDVPGGWAARELAPPLDPVLPRRVVLAA